VSYRIDHAVYAVRDLAAAADRWREAYGLGSAPGGRHPRWGTTNRIVPLGREYLELIAVVDRAVAAGTVLGRTLLGLIDGGDGWFSLCLADDDLEGTAARLGLEVETGSRTTPEGLELRWRAAGIEAEQREPWLPFFIAWDVPAEQHPGRGGAEHPAGAEGIASAEIAGDASRLREWLGGAEAAIHVVDGPPGLRSVSLRRPGGDLVVT
jgi:glyoxalase-like protein